jgi:hypothetical protein
MASGRMMSLRSLVFLIIVSVTAGSAAIATPVDFGGTLVEVDYWTGAGSNEAIVVIDFGVDSYAFGYRWESGTKYGKDLMDAVANAGLLDYTETGGFLNTISYSSYSNIGQDGWPDDWWSYFISGDGESWDVSWDEGFATRVLSDGVWDGWAHQSSDDWPPAHSPTTPIPEPMTIALLGLGGLLLGRRRA